MKRYLLLLAVVALLFAGCNGENADNGDNGLPTEGEDERVVPDRETEYGTILTEEREAMILNYAAPYQEMFSIYSIVEKDRFLEIWLDVGPEPITDNAVQGLTEGLIGEIAGLFDGELSLHITALQQDENEEYVFFGTSVYSAETGEFTYEAP